MANNYVYILDGKAYVNLTNKCHNACSFCIRATGDDVAGTPLWLDKEPTTDEVIAQFNALMPQSNEVVFCGFGEPTENLETLKACAKRFKEMGYSTRLNTNGLGSLVNGKDIIPDLKDIDVVSVSLNQCDADKYFEVTRSAFGRSAFAAVVDFARKCKAAGLNTVFTAVDTIGPNDVDACKALCEELKIPLRVRKYVADNYESSK
ncbi:MAG: radical SAM protein [Clostridiales bacterium]|nr:radical SAM protein [Clostridiales bacterium]